MGRDLPSFGNRNILGASKHKEGPIMKYEIIGEHMPVVVCDLEANEAMIT